MPLDFCVGVSGNPSTGDECLVGSKIGMLFSLEKNTPIDKTTASLQATYSALQKQEGNKRLHYIPFKNFTAGETTSTSFTDDIGNQTKISEQKAPNEIIILGDVCNLRSIYNYFKTQKKGYVFWQMTENAIEGREVTDNTISQVAVSIFATVMDGDKDNPRRIKLTISETENYYSEVIDVRINWAIIDLTLTNITDMKFVLGDNTLTTQIVEVTSPCGKEITTLNTTTPHFLAYNVTDSAAIVITGVTRSGNDYELTFAAQTEADVIKVWYDTVTNSGELYEMLEDNAPTKPLTA